MLGISPIGADPLGSLAAVYVESGVGVAAGMASATGAGSFSGFITGIGTATGLATAQGLGGLSGFFPAIGVATGGASVSGDNPDLPSTPSPEDLILGASLEGVPFGELEFTVTIPSGVLNTRPSVDLGLNLVIGGSFVGGMVPKVEWHWNFGA